MNMPWKDVSKQLSMFHICKHQTDFMNLVMVGGGVNSEGS
jgi:hypothetical protein